MRALPAPRRHANTAGRSLPDPFPRPPRPSGCLWIWPDAIAEQSAASSPVQIRASIGGLRTDVLALAFAPPATVAAALADCSVLLCNLDSATVRLTIPHGGAPAPPLTPPASARAATAPGARRGSAVVAMASTAGPPSAHAAAAAAEGSAVECMATIWTAGPAGPAGQGAAPLSHALLATGGGDGALRLYEPLGGRLICRHEIRALVAQAESAGGGAAPGVGAAGSGGAAALCAISYYAPLRLLLAGDASGCVSVLSIGRLLSACAAARNAPLLLLPAQRPARSSNLSCLFLPPFPRLLPSQLRARRAVGGPAQAGGAAALARALGANRPRSSLCARAAH